ncbi:molybdenum metabolism regulator [Bacillus sp. FJAT-27225]|uniref:DUF4240 domain-containing protein n=1 Tax=Bacillus sp. FJAT-27225 TaxID=1743144 RepID=UPI00080C21B2|nr:DUF4240 domain-containing protein [Bacillus sp. FJAT-27225]OCA88096.1 molybdenum metabolism regulator [Bacillus sp. FJAT-27225]
MERHEFWALIEKSKGKENQAEWLTEELAKRNAQEIIDFEFWFQGLLNESYQSNLWAAAYIVMGGCSDDSFDYFRGWLIGQGEEAYNQVMANPEYLADYIEEDNLGEEGVPEYEELLSVGLDAYSLKKTGDTEWDDDTYDELQQALDKKGLKPQTDIDLDWDEDDLEDMYPRLWERFGEEPLGY